MGISDATRRKIKRKRRHGVKKNIKTYGEDIFKTFYDEKLLKEKLNEYIKRSEIKNLHTENLSDAFLDYLKAVGRKTNELLQKAKEHIEESYTKGSNRILDENGNKVKLDAEPDNQAIRILTKEQNRLFKNLNNQQTKVVNTTISKGIEKGKSYEEIADDIQKRVKTTTRASAMRISRSEIVKSHNAGQVDTMQKAGIEHYSYINSPEYTSNGKTWPCQICKKLQGPKGREHIYDVQRAGTSEKNPLPVTNSHPNCRCSTVIRTDKQ